MILPIQRQLILQSKKGASLIEVAVSAMRS